jgi:hypothetical protein
MQRGAVFEHGIKVSVIDVRCSDQRSDVFWAYPKQSF